MSDVGKNWHSGGDSTECFKKLRDHSAHLYLGKGGEGDTVLEGKHIPKVCWQSLVKYWGSQCW